MVIPLDDNKKVKENIMKKLISLLLVSTMVLTMVACGAKSAEAPAAAPAAEAPAAEAPAAEEAAPAAEEAAPAAEGTTIRIGAIPGTISDEMRLFGDMFEAENPGVTVEIVEFDEGTYQSQATRIFTSAENNLDAVWFYRPNFWDDFTANGVYEPLNDIYEQEDMVNGYGEAIANIYKEGDNYYGVPDSTCWVGNLFYNKKLMEENGWSVPQTWEELYDFAAAVKAKGLIPIAVACKDSYAENFSTPINIRVFDADAYATIAKAGQTEIPLTDDRWKAVWDEVAKLQKYVLQDGAAAADSTVASSLFYQGQAVMYMEGSWGVGSIAADAPEGFEFGYAMLPAYQEDIPARVCTYPGNMMAVLSISQNKDLAKQFVALVGSKEGQEKLAESGINSPARVDISADAKASMGELYAQMYDDMEKRGSDMMTSMLLDTEFFNTFCQVTQGVLAGSMSSDEACERMQETWDEIYN